MNVVVIGSGGREHAIIWALRRSKGIGKIFAVPGNGGTAKMATNVLLKVSDAREVRDFCIKNQVEFVIIGPEAPLVDGLSDKLNSYGILCFGVSAEVAKLEGSKSYTKYICDKYNIDTAQYAKFTDANEALKYLASCNYPIVIKADGLASGKGVVIAQNKDEANQAIQQIMVDKIFADAGSIVVIEEFLVGEELSFFALIDGNTVREFGSAQDHKAVGDGDTGPNTGGMGTYSPAPILDEALRKKIMSDIVSKIADAMVLEGHPYRGILFAGLMITKTGPKLLEINVRFGDPETQSLMARLDSDLLELLVATAKGELDQKQVRLKDKAALCVVMAAKGYPGDYKKGGKIEKLNLLEDIDNVMVFHAGTKLNDQGEFIANGGRVLGVTSWGINVTEAQNRAYKAVAQIKWDDGFCRKDIGWRAVERENKKLV